MHIESSDTAHAIGTAGALLVCLWRTETTLAAIATLNRVATRLASAHRGQMVMITIVESGADMPDARVRDELSELFRKLGTAVVCSGLVFEGQGFRAAAVRAITTSINLVAKQPFPHKVFGTAEDAASWLAGHPAAGLSAADILREVAQARRSMDRAAQPGR